MPILDDRNPSYVDYSSDINRRMFAHQALLRSAEKSVWTPLTGTDPRSVVVHVKNHEATTGITVVVDRVGFNVNEFLLGTDPVFGRGEKRHIFSNTLTVVEFVTVLPNGTKFEGKAIGNLAISEHSQAVMLLADSFQQGKDQMMFDAAQGLFEDQPATHVIDLTGSSFDYNALLDIERTIKVSKDFDTGDSRIPLQPYQLYDGRPCWILMMDPYAAYKLKKSANYQNLVYNADVRGNSNRAISGVFGKIGNLLLKEVPIARSVVKDGHKISIQGVRTESAGLRQYDTVNGKWSGETGFSEASTLNSRMLVVGANAIQFGTGKTPEYLYQPVPDNMSRTSYSALSAFMQVQKTRYATETKDYTLSKVDGIDFGVIAVDVRI